MYGLCTPCLAIMYLFGFRGCNLVVKHF
jgi:hypothetical protein